MKIAIVKLSALGDIVHAMVTLQFIKKRFPDARIDWIVEEGFAGLLADNPHIDSVLPVRLKALKRSPFRLFSEIGRLKEYAKNNYDIVIDLQGLIKSGVLARILGPSVGFDRHSIRESAATIFYRKSFSVPYEMNVISRNMTLVDKALDMETSEEQLRQKEPFLFFGDAEKESIASFFQGGQKSIVYVLGSSWQSKIYPKEQLVEVIDALDENALLVWGNDKERKDAGFIASRTHAAVLPKLTLGELKALISETDLVIGGDSGPTHFAWALNCPSITLFGPTPSLRNTLVGGFTRVLSSSSEVDPMRLNREDFSIGEIESSEIVSVAQELLSSSDSTSKEQG